MQDLQQIPGLTGRIFTGTTHLRHLHLNNPSTTPVQPQPVKCPRCDSSNTKFCYYNNYNLSQPRHYCKSCRRYWTKGGVLRNVPVGGGCRKTSKRASSKSKPDKKPAHVPSSGSSSESSSNPKPQPIAPTVAAEAEPRPEAELTAGLIDFTDPSLVQEEKVNGFDWGNGSEDSGSLFDIMNPTVNYWNQTNWGETDPNSLYLP